MLYMIEEGFEVEAGYEDGSELEQEEEGEVRAWEGAVLPLGWGPMGKEMQETMWREAENA
jgi:hypothetical protein